MIQSGMESVTVRALRNNGGEVLDRVVAGESLVVTRDGKEVAELIPRRRPAVATAELIARRRNLPLVDPEKFRQDIDDTIDPSL